MVEALRLRGNAYGQASHHSGLRTVLSGAALTEALCVLQQARQDVPFSAQIGADLSQPSASAGSGDLELAQVLLETQVFLAECHPAHLWRAWSVPAGLVARPACLEAGRQDGRDRARAHKAFLPRPFDLVDVEVEAGDDDDLIERLLEHAVHDLAANLMRELPSVAQVFFISLGEGSIVL